ncbi:MAG: YraN family protein [Candidatus Andersenbacteria bacterium]
MAQTAPNQHLTNQQLGQIGESLVTYALGERGFTVVARNVRTRYGEIDLIAQKEGITIFVEVKTRTSRRFGYPEEAVDRKKRLHLSRACLSLAPKYARTNDYAILVVAVELDLAARAAKLVQIQLDE